MTYGITMAVLVWLKTMFAFMMMNSSFALLACEFIDTISSSSLKANYSIEQMVSCQALHWIIVKLVSGDDTVQKRTNGGRDCCRPGCRKRKLKDEYYGERLIGKKLVGGRPIKGSNEYIWLVKWSGYPISQATWQLEKTLGDVTSLISRFQEDAGEEGLATDTNGEILLNDAVYNQPTAGWPG